MRVFIAIELPEPIRERIAQIQERLKETKDGIKWVNPSSLHLTLKFLGEIEEESLEKVFKVAEEVAGRFFPFSMGMEGIGVFPGFSSPRVIWIGVDEGKKVLEDLAGQLEEGLKKEGFAKEKRKWRPHLTLGRVKFLKEKEKLKELMEGQKGIGKRMRVENISVIQSRLTPKGPIYTVLKKIRLGG